MTPFPTLADAPDPPAGRTGWPWTVEPTPLPPTRANGSAWPRVSIVTPSYNQGQYIEETIRSVLLQGYPDLEYVIIDGGSTDGTVGIIKKYEPWLSFWVSEKDRGQTYAINTGLSRSTGGILNWLNSDDFLAPHALARVAERFAVAPPDVGAIAGIGHVIDLEGRIVASPTPHQVTLDRLFAWTDDDVAFQQPACFFTREAWQHSGPLPEQLHYAMDVALWVRIAGHFRFDVFPETIAYAHQHPAAKTVARWPYSKGELALVFASHPAGLGPATHLLSSLIEQELARGTDDSVARRLARLTRLDRLGWPFAG